MKYEKIKNDVNEAIELRERGKLAESRVIFEEVVNVVEKLLEKESSKEVNDLYAVVIGEFVIQHRLEGQALYLKALEMGEKLLDWDEKNKVGNVLSKKAVSNTLIDLKRYESAVNLIKQLINESRGNSARVGDEKAHLAYCYLRSSRLDEAGKLINEAIPEIEKNSADMPHIPVYKSHALIVKALIKVAEGNMKQALEIASEAKKVAEKGGYSFRVKQAQSVIDLLS